MRIAVDLTPMRPGGENGGVKFAILEFLKGLKAHLGDRLFLLLLTADDTHDEAASILGKADLASCVLRRAGRGNFSQTVSLATRSKVLVSSLLQRHRIDVLYCPFGTVSFVTERMPTVAMIVDLLHREFPFSLPAQTVEWREWQFQRLIDSVDDFQTISQFTADRLNSLYNVPREQIFVTHLPIHGRLPALAAKREPFFFYPANFWLHKNHEVLLVAYQIYLASATENKPWDLVLTGHPDERCRQIQELAADLGIAAHVKFLGYVSETKLARIYSTASSLVFPSLHEGYGIPIVEAMSFGLPIVCGRDTSLPEIAGDAALYADTRNPVKLAKALLRIAEDEGLRDELATLGRQRLQAFDFSAEVRRLADLLAMAKARNRRLNFFPRRNFFKDLRVAGLYRARALARKALKVAVEVPLGIERWSTKISASSHK